MPGNTPHTPPYTPAFSKQRFARADSPASIHSIHPTETVSPAQKAEKRNVEDGVSVEELTEADAGYIADVDIVYPEELEEPISEGEQYISSSNDDSDIDISQPFSRLDCVDGAEIEFEMQRRAKHVRKRTDSRVFKRTHSTSVKSDMEITDSDAMADHDRTSSARRLRRRTHGQSGVKVVYDEASQASPSIGRSFVVNDGNENYCGRREGDTETSSATDAMEVDESDS